MINKSDPYLKTLLPIIFGLMDLQIMGGSGIELGFFRIIIEIQFNFFETWFWLQSRSEMRLFDIYIFLELVEFVLDGIVDGEEMFLEVPAIEG